MRLYLRQCVMNGLTLITEKNGNAIREYIVRTHPRYVTPLDVGCACLLVIVALYQVCCPLVVVVVVFELFDSTFNPMHLLLLVSLLHCRWCSWLLC